MVDMKRIVMALLLCLASPAYAAPSIEFVSETHDFGHVTQGEPQEHVFEFTNTGTDELVIEWIEAT
jgi:hypothetical protein